MPMSDFNYRMMSDYLKHADVVMLVGDITKASTFQDIGDNIVKKITDYCRLHYDGVPPVLTLIANKRDLSEAVPSAALMTDEVCAITAHRYGCPRSFLASAYTDVKVDDAFDQSVAAAVKLRRVWHEADPKVRQQMEEAERKAKEEEEARARAREEAAKVLAAADAEADLAIAEGGFDAEEDEGRDSRMDDQINRQSLSTLTNTPRRNSVNGNGVLNEYQITQVESSMFDDDDSGDVATSEEKQGIGMRVDVVGYGEEKDGVEVKPTPRRLTGITPRNGDYDTTNHHRNSLNHTTGRASTSNVNVVSAGDEFKDEFDEETEE